MGSLLSGSAEPRKARDVSRQVIEEDKVPQLEDLNEDWQ
jgi:hypothetical protein